MLSVPKPLTDTEISTAQGTTLSYYGYKFEVPWTGINSEIKHSDRIEVSFKSGQLVTFVDPQLFQRDRFSDPHVAKDLHTAFGQNIKRSKYDHFKDMMSITRKQLSPFRSRPAVARDRAYLTLKGFWFAHDRNETDIFSIDTPIYRGFQVGKPPYPVSLNLFDAADHEFYMGITIMHGSTATQADINRVIQSLRPAP